MIQAQSPDSVVQVWDSVTGRFIDSVVVRSPLPDPLVPIVQWIFQQPGWVMAAEIVLGAILAVVVLVLAWRRRRAIVDLARHPRARGQAGHGRCGRHRAAVDGRHGCQGVRLHDARQRLLPGLPHLRAQRPGVRSAGHRDLSPGQQAGGQARHPVLSCLPPLRDQGPEQGTVLLDHGAAGQDPPARQGAPRDLRAMPRDGPGQGHVEADHDHRRPPDPPRVRLARSARAWPASRATRARRTGSSRPTRPAPSRAATSPTASGSGSAG